MKKYNRQIRIDTLKLLLARSGNQCSFPNCYHPLFDDNNLFIAQLCHIEAVSPRGQRYNPNKSNEETNSYDNLLFLCYRHHKETDNINNYTVEKLKQIKADHETKFKESSFNYPNEALDTLIKEIDMFWEHVDELHSDHIVPELAVPIDVKSDIISLIAEINSNLKSLNEVNSVLMEDYKTEHFEYLCLSMPNLLTRISVALDQVEIKYTEELLFKNPNNVELKNKLKHLRDNFKTTSQTAGLAD